MIYPSQSLDCDGSVRGTKNSKYSLPGFPELKSFKKLIRIKDEIEMWWCVMVVGVLGSSEEGRREMGE